MRDGLVLILSAMLMVLVFGCGDGPEPPAGRGSAAPPAPPADSAPPLSVDALPDGGNAASAPPAASGRASTQPAAAPSPSSSAPAPQGFAQKVVARARREAASKSGYDPKYYGIPYPGGDVPGPGVCTDLVVRALRAGGVDLQKLVHEDRRANLTVYPDQWQPRVLDSSIDHRRVANLMCFFRRKGSWLKTTTGSGAAASWRAGDLVFWELSPGGRLHCGVVSDRSGPSGRPMVIHNLSAAAEEDCLTKWKVIGHARWTAAGPAAAAGGGAQPASRPRAAERKKTYSFEDDPEAKG